jgi:hypothetical protein
MHRLFTEGPFDGVVQAAPNAPDETNMRGQIMSSLADQVGALSCNNQPMLELKNGTHTKIEDQRIGVPQGATLFLRLPTWSQGVEFPTRPGH